MQIHDLISSPEDYIRFSPPYTMCFHSEERKGPDSGTMEHLGLSHEMQCRPNYAIFFLKPVNLLAEPLYMAK
jgi:hypothetical protein